MSLYCKSVNAFLLALALILPVSTPTITVCADEYPDLVIRVGDTTGIAGLRGIAIPVRMNNYSDTVAGFEIRVTSDRPDLISFQRVLDTAGSLISGWELVGTELMGESEDTLRIVGMANNISPYGVTPGIGFPQLEPTPLLRLLVDVAELPVSSDPQFVNIRLLTEDATGLIFSDEEGRAIGILVDSTLDTTWYDCVDWDDPEQSVCNDWQQVDGPPADTTVIQWHRTGSLDTTSVLVFDGILRVDPTVCGDANGNDGVVTLSDITCVISFVYLGGPEPASMWAANANGSDDDRLTLSDITMMIDHLYIAKGSLDCR